MPQPQNILDLLTGGASQPQDDTGLAGQILASRFQPQEPSWNDVGNSALASVGAGKYVDPHSYGDARMVDSMKRLEIVAQLQKLSQGDLPQGYRMNGQTGQAELIPGVDPSFGKKADSFGGVMPVIMPNGQPGFAPKSDVTQPGYKPFTPPAKPPSGYDFGPNDEAGAPTLLPIPGGPADPANKPANEYQGKSGLFAARMSEAEPVLGDLGPTSGTSVKQRGLAGVPLVGNYLVDSDYQKLDQAERNFVNATLRQESGASINQSEFDNAVKQYFPRPGDGPGVIAQKAQNRKTAIQQMIEAAGPAYKARLASSGTGGNQPPQSGAGGNGAQPMPRAGDVILGHRYKGGNPNNPSSWEAAP